MMALYHRPKARLLLPVEGMKHTPIIPQAQDPMRPLSVYSRSAQTQLRTSKTIVRLKRVKLYANKLLASVPTTDKWNERKKETGFNDVANNRVAIRILLGAPSKGTLIVEKDGAKGDPPELPRLNPMDHKTMISNACSDSSSRNLQRYRRGCAQSPHLYARLADARVECHKMFERLGAAKVPQCEDGFIPFCIPSIIKYLIGDEIE
ncbi:hypothetical protein I7I51_04634 [Histoplasma capsulatum]|uniref:Uncharacterized protein n=1 Tax=Ajellomyces capsulatus TaxID=5037 RepID=A0A8A1M061_AJECA|nr:hypothetical protein I7I51_04634 [Histoplasma capsulatum]